VLASSAVLKGTKIVEWLLSSTAISYEAQPSDNQHGISNEISGNLTRNAL
jgi:hypothetical protein